MRKLFLRTPRLPGDIRVIGSCLDDYFVKQARERIADSELPHGKPLSVWGAGLRRPGGLDKERGDVDIRAVRGPLTVSELGLGADFPIGDPGLLLPALYSPKTSTRFAGRTLCVPHFHDKRTDADLLTASGAELILRPNVPNSITEVEAFIDALTSARFVICGSLHAAIVAVAYKVPFAFWESGCVDLPFKWHDFAASVGIDCVFCPDVAEGERTYANAISPRLRIPELWDLLAVAPFPIRPEALISILAHFSADPGTSTLPEIARIFARRRHRLEEIVGDAETLLNDFHERNLDIAEKQDEQARHQERRSREFSKYKTLLQNSETALEAERQESQLRIAVLKEKSRTRLKAARRDNQQRVAAMRAAGDRLAQELMRSYSNPLRPLRKGLERFLLRFVLLLSPILPGRSLRSLRHAAAKRKPLRFRQQWEEACGLPGPSQAQGPVSATAFGATPPATEVRLLDGVTLPVHVPGSADPIVSIIIPTYGQVDYTINCVAALAACPPTGAFEVIVMDDAYPGPEAARLETAFEGVRLVRNESNRGFLHTCNAAAGMARGRYLFFLNNDTQLQPGAIDALVDLLDADPAVGMTGSKLIYPDGTLQEAGGLIWRDGTGWNLGRGSDPRRPEYNYRREADYISGAAIMVRAELFARLGGFDKAYEPAYCEDSDLAFRIREAGFSVVYEPRSEVVHFEGKSHGTDVGTGVKAYQLANSKRLHQRWKEVLMRDGFDGPQDLLRARDRARHRRVILVIDHYVPEPDRDAGSRTIMRILESLRADDWVVKFWPQNRRYSPTYTPPLQDMGIEVLDSRWPGSFQDWIAENGHALDHVLTSRPSVAPEFLDDVIRNSDAHLSYYGHDLHFLRMRRQAESTGDAGLLNDAEAMEELEKSLWHRVDTVLYPSNIETSLVRQAVPGTNAHTIVPYCFDAFEARTEPVRNHTLLFVGGFAHAPNIDAAEFLVRDVMPLVWLKNPDARLLLVGSHPTDAVKALAGDRVEVTGWVSDEALWQHYRAARAAVIPLRFGAGIKSKVVEALSLGVPLVTTPIGTEGLPGLEDIVNVREDAGALAASLVRLLEDDALWMEISAGETAYAERHFSRRALAHSLLGALG
ncbi:glycosyltransferase [Ancylobacter oerskovii]|nr:glycosyltransferase [Ancylobacter oerskovii]